MICAALALQTTSIIKASRGAPLLGREPGGDFGQFYCAGKILNEYSGAALYNQDLHARLYHGIVPYADRGRALPYVYPPIVAAAFRPLARLPYAFAYGLWLVISAGVYAAGLFLICPRSLAVAQRRTAVLVALSFCPFLFEAWGGGQLSVIGFAALAAAIRLEQSGKEFAAGLAAGVCFYKPTLLVVLLPLLLLARRWRMLAGALTAGLAQAILAFAAVGGDALFTYPRTLVSYGQFLSGHPGVLAKEKYVDLNMFLHLLPGGGGVAGRAVFVLVAAAALAFAARNWARYGSKSPEKRAACWAGTLPLALIVSVYTPIYDVTLVVLSGFLVAGIVYTPERKELASAFEGLTLLLYLATVLSQPVARLLGIQIVSIVLAAFAAFAFRLPARIGTATCAQATEAAITSRAD